MLLLIADRRLLPGVTASRTHEKLRGLRWGLAKAWLRLHLQGLS